MQLAIVNLCVSPHQLDVLKEVLTVFVLITFSFVLHVLQAYRPLNQVTVVRCVLFCYLVVKALQCILVPHFLEYFSKNLVKCLITLLLALAVRTVIRNWLVIVKIFFRKSMRLKSLSWWRLFLKFTLLRLNFIVASVKSNNHIIISNLSLFIAVFFILHQFVVIVLFRNIDHHFIVIFVDQLWLKFKTYLCCILLWCLVHNLIVSRSIINLDYWLRCHWLILLFFLLKWRSPIDLHSTVCPWVNTLCFSRYLNTM